MDPKKINKIKSNNKLLQKAHRLRESGNIKDSKSLYQKLVDSNNWIEQLEGINGLALTHKMAEEYEKAIKHYYKAIRVSKENNYLNRIKDIWRDIAIAHQCQEKYHQAEEAYQQAIKLTKKYGYGDLNSNPSYGITLVKYGYLYFLKEDCQKAEKLIKKGLKILKQANHKLWLTTGKIHLAQLYLETNRKERALKILNRIAVISKKENWHYKEAKALKIIDNINKTSNNKKRINELIEKINNSKMTERLENNSDF